MKLINEKTKNIVYGITIVLVTITTAVLVVLGIIGITSFVSSLRSALATEAKQEPEQRVITVDSKRAEDYGMYCYEVIFTHCNKKTKYFVNEKKVTKDFYDSVREGGTYTCKISRFNDNLYDCKPKVQGGDEEE